MKSLTPKLQGFYLFLLSHPISSWCQSPPRSQLSSCPHPCSAYPKGSRNHHGHPVCRTQPRLNPAVTLFWAHVTGGVTAATTQPSSSPIFLFIFCIPLKNLYIKHPKFHICTCLDHSVKGFKQKRYLVPPSICPFHTHHFEHFKWFFLVSNSIYLSDICLYCYFFILHFRLILIASYYGE